MSAINELSSSISAWWSDFLLFKTLDYNALVNLVFSRYFQGAVAIIIILLIIFVEVRRYYMRERRLLRSLRRCWREITDMLEVTNEAPLFLRLAWSDAMSYDCTIPDWPYCGGVNGSVRFESEITDSNNAGLAKALSILSPIKAHYPNLSWADVIQMAGAVAVFITGGPFVSLIYGRVDVPIDLREADEKEARRRFNPTSHLRWTATDIRRRFMPSAVEHGEDGHRRLMAQLGLSARDFTALCGAHTLGRAFSDRSGVCPRQHSSGDQGATKYTRLTSTAKGPDKGPLGGSGVAGGISWTAHWLRFDNEYFRRPYDSPHDKELLWLPMDIALMNSPDTGPFCRRYAEDAELFRRDYAIAHERMSELGAKLEGLVLRPTEEQMTRGRRKR